MLTPLNDIGRGLQAAEELGAETPPAVVAVLDAFKITRYGATEVAFGTLGAETYPVQTSGPESVGWLMEVAAKTSSLSLGQPPWRRGRLPRQTHSLFTREFSTSDGL